MKLLDREAVARAYEVATKGPLTKLDHHWVDRFIAAFEREIGGERADARSAALGNTVPPRRRPPMGSERDGRTHYEGCWETRGHHDCAIAEIKRRAAAGAPVCLMAGCEREPAYCYGCAEERFAPDALEGQDALEERDEQIRQLQKTETHLRNLIQRERQERKASAPVEVERAALALVNRIEAEGGKGYEIHDLARALRVALATPAEAKEERG